MCLRICAVYVWRLCVRTCNVYILLMTPFMCDAKTCLPPPPPGPCSPLDLGKRKEYKISFICRNWLVDRTYLFNFSLSFSIFWQTIIRLGNYRFALGNSLRKIKKIRYLSTFILRNIEAVSALDWHGRGRDGGKILCQTTLRPRRASYFQLPVCLCSCPPEVQMPVLKTFWVPQNTLFK